MQLLYLVPASLALALGGYVFGVLAGRTVGIAMAKLIHSDEELHSVGALLIGARVEFFADCCGIGGAIVAPLVLIMSVA